jgi:hypothetical protein
LNKPNGSGDLAPTSISHHTPMMQQYFCCVLRQRLTGIFLFFLTASRKNVDARG